MQQCVRLLLGVGVLIGICNLAWADTPGTQLGETTIDQQQKGSSGRQLAVRSERLQAVWTWYSGFSRIAAWDTRWNKIHITGSPANHILDNGSSVSRLPLGNLGTAFGVNVNPFGNQKKYPSFRSLPTERGIGVQGDSVAINGANLWVYADNALAIGVFSGDVAPAPTGVLQAAYPRLAWGVHGSDTVLHIIGTEWSLSAVQQIYYWRGILTGVTVTWSTPILVDTVTTFSATIEASPTTDEVAIVYAKPRSAGLDRDDNDIYYRRSVDGGLSWSLPTAAVTFNGPNRAYTDLDAVYDDDNTLHVVFNTQSTGSATDPSAIPCRMFHWSTARTTPREIARAEWRNTCSVTDSLRGGLWDLQMAKPTLTVKPAGEGAGSGIADEVIYAVWVQFGPTTTDCASQDSAGTAGGYVNGELWCSASSDDGLTWDRPQNITGTETPACLPGDCHSEHWVSASARADSGIYLAYVDDSHAGSILDFEGAWSMNRFMAYAIETRLPEVSPRIAISPKRTPYPRVENSTHYYMSLTPSTAADSTFQFSIKNLGTATLSYIVEVLVDDLGDQHVRVNGSNSYSNSRAAGSSRDMVLVNYDGIGLQLGDTFEWLIRIVSNDPVTDTIIIHMDIDIVNPTVSMSGAKFNDINGNGTWDFPAEPGLPDWEIHAEPGGHITTTDLTGSFFFSGLPPGTYTISEEQQPGWAQTFPGGPGTHTVSLSAGEFEDSVYFGNFEVDCLITLPGDVNVTGSVTSADIIYLVGFVFKGGVAPLPCEANGDVNCSGSVTSADIIYLVGFVFKGGDPPCDICTESPLPCQ